MNPSEERAPTSPPPGAEGMALTVVPPPWKAYMVGAKDSKGRQIDLIFSHFDGYIIYEAEGLLELEGKTDEVDKNAQVNRLLTEILSVTPRAAKAKRAIYYQIAVALDTCLGGDGKTAAKILERVLSRATKVKRIKGQLCYLWGCISVAVFISMAYVTCRLLNHSLLSDVLPYMKMATLGGIGGVLSVALNLKKLDVDIELGILYNLSFGAARCMIAVSGALFIHLAIAGNLLLGLVGQTQNHYALLTFAMLAGFSETLVPNSLSQIEGGEGKVTPAPNQ